MRIADQIPAATVAKLRAMVEPARCGYAGKFVYSSRAEARDAVEAMRQRERADWRARPYYCDTCGGWHAASGTGQVRRR
jgi:hypothetical protein